MNKNTKNMKIGDRPECKKCGNQYDETFILNNGKIYCEKCYFKLSFSNIWKRIISKEYREDIKKYR
jgi:late competence protein required for DNA uptake (superfamily II DNA/RNA helicase)